MTCFTSSIVKARRVYMEDARQTMKQSAWNSTQRTRPLVINRTNYILQDSCLLVKGGVELWVI